MTSNQKGSEAPNSQTDGNVACAVATAAVAVFKVRHNYYKFIETYTT